jgi:hypothetical protein
MEGVLALRSCCWHDEPTKREGSKRHRHGKGCEAVVVLRLARGAVVLGRWSAAYDVCFVHLVGGTFCPRAIVASLRTTLAIQGLATRVCGNVTAMICLRKQAR